MSTLKKLRSDMSMNVIGYLIILILLLALMSCVIGNRCLVHAFKEEYATVTYHMADSATVFVNGDHIDQYLEGKERKEYSVAKARLDIACHKLNVSLIYVIKVDQSDYGRFVSVFNCVNNSVDNSSYSEWELGYKRDTTNDEYRAKYRAIYEQAAEYETVFRLHPTDGQHPHITTLVPVKNSAGDVTSILCVQRPVSEMAEAMRPYLLWILLSVSVIGILICILASFFLRKTIIRPVEKVSREATRFAVENVKGEPLGMISKYDVLRDLASSIDSMESDMVEYIENLTTATAEKERFAAELSIAATIQKDSLPDDFPPFPDRNEFDIYASMDPAKEVGGDFYNYFLIDEDHLALMIADVSGKGIPAALFMMMSKIMLDNRIMEERSLSTALEQANEMIQRSNSEEMFVTVWAGILEISTGKIRAVNAGHEKPVIIHPDGQAELIKDRHGFVLGGMEGMKYKEYELQMQPGSKLLVYTDGVPEATSAENELFGTDRMLSAVSGMDGASCREVLDCITDAVNGFVGENEQFDDLTMLCVEYRGVI